MSRLSWLVAVILYRVGAGRCRWPYSNESHRGTDQDFQNAAVSVVGATVSTGRDVPTLDVCADLSTKTSTMLPPTWMRRSGDPVYCVPAAYRAAARPGLVKRFNEV